MNTLVLNYYSRNTLAVLHGLPRDHAVFGADQGKSRSRRHVWEKLLRYPGVRAIERYASPDTDPQGFVDDIVGICVHHDIDFVIPTGTTSTNALSLHKTAIEGRAGVRCAVADYEKLRKVTDKWLAYQLALQAGVPVPTTRLFDPRSAAADQVKGMHYPLVIKPRISYAAIGVHHVHDEAELDALALRLAAEGPPEGESEPLIVQEHVGGALHDVATCARNGSPLGLVSQQRVVSLYDFGGGGIVNITTRDGVLADHARKLLSLAQWDGPMLLDFVRTEQGDVYLLECNPKVWGTTDLALEAGMDLVSMMSGVFIPGEQAGSVSSTEVGVLYRWWFPECLFYWCHRPLTPRKLVRRMRRTAGRYGARRIVSNLRLTDLRHLAGIVMNHVHP